MKTNKVPAKGAKREALRVKGQFWTPDWIADVMAAYVLQEKSKRLLDPALGEGVFFRAAKRYAQENHFDLSLFGRDIDASVIRQAKASGLEAADLQQVEIRDFILDPPREKYPAIIANPPYIRHHRLAAAQKEQLKIFAKGATGHHIDARAGLHVYFLIKALQVLEPGGRLAFIVSADICEGVFARKLWQWIASHFKLDAVITFEANATPFPEVDTNALVFLIRNIAPGANIDWVTCLKPDSRDLISFVNGQGKQNYTTIKVFPRSLSEALTTGLSRPPSDEAAPRCTLGDFASVMRGIVTGDNEFFFMTSARARELGIPDSLLISAVGRMRDIKGDTFDLEDIQRLEEIGRPTKLLYVNGLSYDQIPAAVRDYLAVGENKGIPHKVLIKTRKPWYRMETRKAPPIMFAYLGRRNARFIRNRAGVVPLTCLLCIYPKLSAPDFVERLWNVLSAPETIKNLRKVGKSYGGGAIKVEPRSLEQLPLPDTLVQVNGLDRYLSPKQCFLDFSN